ncbi:MAG: TerC/Alx family metal homeostasis membrane protein [Gammaproteobacteria bacterium]|nr:TerC/Alx family metal homeostasis membrane protein [Gammaproteobacteria bacterium]MDH4256871.1 TerC/Alx family metal homeostasis membrane protein [Gammaproteobacteria bacterium]MDH5311456.1 TerC/Alx family metal homeostasis membrane protein [Gammaproteobacteria bacterium]
MQALTVPGYVWLAFLGFILLVILLDLGVFHRRAHVVSIPEALGWSGVWIALAMVFNGIVFLMYSEGGIARPELALESLTGEEAALKFLAGYLTEKSLSLDNIFVIAMIMTYFRVPHELQHRLLIWGVIGAVILRGVMIGFGVILVEKFSWMHYLFGILLIVSAAKMLVTRHDNVEPDKNIMIRLVRRVYPVAPGYEDGRFFTSIDGRKAVTPLFLALVLIETSDLIFAIDSIPAIFAITRDPFLIWTSNVFAILGLRSLYFALAGLMHRFRYLKTSLVFLLVYVGIKLLIADYYDIPVIVSLAMIFGILAVGVGASVFASDKDTAALKSPLASQLESMATVTLRQGRRVAVLVIGSTLLVIGAALLVLPGPGILTMALGLSVLAAEFLWARAWLARLRARLADAHGQARRAYGDFRGSGD